MYVFLFRFIRLSRKNVQTGQDKTFFRRTFRVFIVFFYVLRSFSFFFITRTVRQSGMQFLREQRKTRRKGRVNLFKRIEKIVPIISWRTAALYELCASRTFYALSYEDHE